MDGKTLTSENQKKIVDEINAKLNEYIGNSKQK